MSTSSRLTPRFDEAFLYASRLHARQRRKGSGTPYISHLMSVAALVLEDGGDEDEAIAALLHDAVEDQGGEGTLDVIRARFGDRVTGIVAGCTDAYTIPKPPWTERKERYVSHLGEGASPEVIRVSLADKLHNARSILLDFRQCGDALWSRFTASKEQTLWYYRALLEVYRQVSSSPLVEELARVLVELEQLCTTA